MTVIESRQQRKQRTQFGSRLLRLLPSLLITAGLLLLAAVGAMKWHAHTQQQRMLDTYAAMVRDAMQQPQPDKPAVQTAEAPAVLPDPDQMLNDADGEADTEPPANEPPAALPVTPIALMSIPKINLTVAVGDGVDVETLRYTVGRFTNTAMPGETGNFSVIGHRNYTFGQFFNRLDELAAGDEVIVERGGETHTYRITESFVVEPEDTWVLRGGDEAEITLITCTPIRIATHRLVVKGVLESSIATP